MLAGEGVQVFLLGIADEFEKFAERPISGLQCLGLRSDYSVHGRYLVVNYVSPVFELIILCGLVYREPVELASGPPLILQSFQELTIALLCSRESLDHLGRV